MDRVQDTEPPEEAPGGGLPHDLVHPRFYGDPGKTGQGRGKKGLRYSVHDFIYDPDRGHRSRDRLFPLHRQAFRVRLRSGDVRGRGQSQPRDVPLYLFRVARRPLHGCVELTQNVLRPRIFTGAAEPRDDRHRIRPA